MFSPLSRKLCNKITTTDLNNVEYLLFFLTRLHINPFGVNIGFPGQPCTHNNGWKVRVLLYGSMWLLTLRLAVWGFPGLRIMLLGLCVGVVMVSGIPLLPRVGFLTIQNLFCTWQCPKTVFRCLKLPQLFPQFFVCATHTWRGIHWNSINLNMSPN
jgi:hypothetical protein